MEPPLPSSKCKELNEQNTNPNSPLPSPLRLWRPAAQRNIRNQWSKLLASKGRWFSAASEARSHATSFVNAHLSERYLPEMDLGTLKDMPSIRQKASEKLAKKQEVCCSNLLSSYKEMVASVAHMVQSSSSMRCFLKVSGASSLVQFCDQQEDVNDPGDGGGIPVFSLLSISNFESVAQELVEMFLLELNLKRLLVVELLGLNYKEGGGQANLLSWFHELYLGEFDGLRMSSIHGNENSVPLPPRIKDWQSGDPLANQSKHARSREVLQVYLTTWLADVNINMNSDKMMRSCRGLVKFKGLRKSRSQLQIRICGLRMHEIFAMVEGEIQVKLS